MELRKTEESVQELVGLYESIRQSTVLREIGADACLPEFVVKQPPLQISSTGSSTDGAVDGNAGNDSGLQAEQSIATAGATTSTTQSISPRNINVETLPDMAAAVKALNHVQTTLALLPPKIERFRKRMSEKDPVTGKPRFGEKTQFRVEVMVEAYDFLIANIPPSNEEYSSSESYATTTSQNILLKLKERHLHQASSEQQAKEEAERERQRIEEEARLEALRLEELERQLATEAADRQRQEQAAAEAELRRQAEAARQRRLAQERAEQEWEDSIPKGPEGVKSQLSILKEATKDDPEAQATAITSLYTIFQQINAHPEETKFRRIRRDHEKFTQDIGCHKGGVEVLIAAGFELGAIDDVPCYLSKEPNIETDMDGWSTWFDLLKATLEILEQEASTLPKSSVLRK